MSNDVWSDPMQLVLTIENNLLIVDDGFALFNTLSQYNVEKHMHILKQYFQKLLETNDLEQADRFLKTFRNAYRFIQEHGGYDDEDKNKNNYESPFCVVRAIIEAALWNWEHTPEMDRIILNNPQCVDQVDDIDDR